MINREVSYHIHAQQIDKNQNVRINLKLPLQSAMRTWKWRENVICRGTTTGDSSKDLLSSTTSREAVSSPFNQVFNFFSVSPTLTVSSAVPAAGKFLKEQYFIRKDGKLRISRVAGRDVFMRMFYLAPQLTTFVTIERFCLRYFAPNESTDYD